MVARGKCVAKRARSPWIICKKQGSPERAKEHAVQHDFSRPFRPETLLYTTQELRFACPWGYLIAAPSASQFGLLKAKPSLEDRLNAFVSNHEAKPLKCLQ